jgi:N-methylhydantoinase A
MQEKAKEILGKICEKGNRISFQKMGDMRYVGQGFEIGVLLPDKVDMTTIELIKDKFYEAYKETYGRSVTDVPVEVVNWRLVATTSPLFEKLVPALQVPDQTPVKGTRNIYAPSQHETWPATVYDHYLLKPGTVISGPAVIEQKECTTVLWPWDKATVDDYQSLYVTVGEM